MNRRSRITAGLFVWLASASAWAEDKSAVHATTSVEVIDDTAHIDEVISRMKTRSAKTPAEPAPDLRDVRPPLAGATPADKKNAAAQEMRRDPWRRQHHERGASTPERLDRPKRDRR